MKGRWQLSSRTIHVVMLTAWALLWAGTFFTLLTGQTRLGLSDLSEQFHAFALYQARAMAEGRLPLWSNGSYGGFPFVADPQSATFYWPRWLTILASPRGTLPFFALELEALFHIWLSGALTYVLAFRETRHHLAALMGAVAFGLGGYLVAYPVLQLAILETITWLPLILFSLSRFAFSPAGKSANRWLAVASLALATAFSAGHPQTFLHLLYLGAAYYLWNCSRAGLSWRRCFARGSVVTLMAVALAAPTWLPVARYAQATGRANVDYAFVSSGESLINFLQLALPGALSLWVPQYAGFAVLVLAVVAIRTDRSGTTAVRFWVLVALGSAWLALGDRGILFELAYRVGPGLSLFRQQERWLGLFNFALVMLAVQGAALSDHLSPRRLLQASAACFGILAFAAVFLVASSRSGSLPGSPSTQIAWLPLLLRQTAIAAVSLGLLLLVTKDRRGNNWAEGLAATDAGDSCPGFRLTSHDCGDTRASWR